MKKVILLNKKEGETPLAALSRFRAKNKKYEGVKMTYAGRLDPMASGVLLVLVGGEVKEKEKYLALDKEYEFEVLFGFATDTYDILGKVEIARQDLASELKLEKLIKNHLKHFTGKFIQKYPIYSSKTVKGKQLFEYGREGKDVELPEREVFVKQLQFLKIRKINHIKLLADIEKRIKKVKGDFRQEEILKIWRTKLSSGARQEFFVASLKINCSSGTYVRGLANSMGEKIGVPVLAYSIKRTKVGKFAKMS